MQFEAGAVFACYCGRLGHSRQDLLQWYEWQTSTFHHYHIRPVPICCFCAAHLIGVIYVIEFNKRHSVGETLGVGLLLSIEVLANGLISDKCHYKDVKPAKL